MSKYTAKVDESVDFGRGAAEDDPCPAIKDEPLLRARPGGPTEDESLLPIHDACLVLDQGPVFDRGHKELDPDPPPLTDDPTDGVKQPLPEQIEQAKQAEAQRVKVA